MPKEEQLRNSIRNALKSLVLKSIEYTVLVLFILLSDSGNSSINSLIFAIAAGFVGLMGLWTIRNLLRRVSKLEKTNDELNKKYENTIKKFLKFILKKEEVSNSYFTDYAILEFSYKGNYFFSASTTFFELFGHEQEPSIRWSLEWLMERVELLSKDDARAMVDSWLLEDFSPENTYNIWMKRENKSNIYVQVFTIPSHDIDGELYGFKVYFRDITGEKAKDDTIEGQRDFIKRSLVDSVRRDIIRERIEKQFEKLIKGKDNGR